jgi:preprotein translocase subunit SecE
MGAWFAKIRVFFEETGEELKKCSWPNRAQLLESTMVVIVALIILAIFVSIVDLVLVKAINFVTTV